MASGSRWADRRSPDPPTLASIARKPAAETRRAFPFGVGSWNPPGAIESLTLARTGPLRLVGGPAELLREFGQRDLYEHVVRGSRKFQTLLSALAILS